MDFLPPLQNLFSLDGDAGERICSNAQRLQIVIQRAPQATQEKLFFLDQLSKSIIEANTKLQEVMNNEKELVCKIRMNDTPLYLLYTQITSKELQEEELEILIEGARLILDIYKTRDCPSSLHDEGKEAALIIAKRVVTAFLYATPEMHEELLERREKVSQDGGHKTALKIMYPEGLPDYFREIYNFFIDSNLTTHPDTAIFWDLITEYPLMDRDEIKADDEHFSPLMIKLSYEASAAYTERLMLTGAKETDVIKTLKKGNRAVSHLFIKLCRYYASVAREVIGGENGIYIEGMLNTEARLLLSAQASSQPKTVILLPAPNENTRA